MLPQLGEEQAAEQPLPVGQEAAQLEEQLEEQAEGLVEEQERPAEPPAACSEVLAFHPS